MPIAVARSKGNMAKRTSSSPSPPSLLILSKGQNLIKQILLHLGAIASISSLGSANAAVILSNNSSLPLSPLEGDTTQSIKQIVKNTGSYSPTRVVRDYEESSPLPDTGKTTIYRWLDELDRSQMFAPCPEGSTLLEFAESTNFLVQTCLSETGGDNPVFWMGFGKDGRGSLTLEINQDFEFWNGSTYYSLERGVWGKNSYILVGRPNGTLEAEAMLYYYHPCLDSDCPNSPTTEP